MIGRLNHVGLAVPDLRRAIDLYRDALGAQSVSDPVSLPEEGITVAFVELANVTIELMEPLDAASPIAKFLQRHPEGGLHHLCYETPDIEGARERLAARSIRLLQGGVPKPGAHGKPVLFLHPKDVCGTLTELEEA